MLFVIPVSCVMWCGIENRPGLIKVLMGWCVLSVTFTAAISMIRFFSFESPVVSRSNAMTIGISREGDLLGVDILLPDPAIVGNKISPTGVPPTPTEVLEDAPPTCCALCKTSRACGAVAVGDEPEEESLHAEVPFVSVAGRAFRRCAPLNALCLESDKVGASLCVGGAQACFGVAGCCCSCCCCCCCC